MNYLLDTCVLSELIKKSPQKSVVTWISDKDEENLYISSITIGEIKKWITRLPESKKKTGLDAWLIELENRFGNRILAIDVEVANKWGFIQGNLEKQGIMMPVIDGLISATAITYGMTIVTRNGKDMSRSGAEIIDPWI